VDIFIVPYKLGWR